MRDLCQDMGGSAKSEQPQSLAVAGDAQRAPADQAGTEQGCERFVAAGIAQREGEACIGHGRRGVAAVARVAGEQGAVAQVLALHPAIRTDAASVAQPGDAHALTERQSLDTGAERIDAADDLMPGDDGHLGLRQLAVDDVQVGSTDPAGGDRDADLPRPRLAVRKFRPFERLADLVQHHGVHGVPFRLICPSPKSRCSRNRPRARAAARWPGSVRPHVRHGSPSSSSGSRSRPWPGRAGAVQHSGTRRS